MTPDVASLLLRDLAVNLQTWADTGARSSVRIWHGEHVYGAQLWQYAQTPPAGGIHKSVHVWADPARAVRVVRGPNSDIACGEVVRRDVFTAPAGSAIYQGGNRAIYQGGNRRNWGIDVSPGRYEGMTRTSRLLTCVRSVHAGSAAEVLVLTPLEAGVVTRGGRAR